MLDVSVTVGPYKTCIGAHRRIQRRLVVRYATLYGSRRRPKYGWISWNCWHWVWCFIS